MYNKSLSTFASIVLITTTFTLPVSRVTIAAMRVDETIQGILRDLDTWQSEFDETDESSSRPFVTVAFAQSLDGYMAPYSDSSNNSTESNYPLSGNEALRLTHALRSMHDGIMVGGRTLSIDNPRLTNRLWKTRHLDAANPNRPNINGEPEYNTPRPIVLDSRLEHVRHLGGNLRVHNPIVCCSSDCSLDDHIKSCIGAGAEILPCVLSTVQGSLDLRYVLRQLKLRFGLRHVIIEGGPQVLSSIFAEGLVDAICVTVTPKFLHTGVTPCLVRATATDNDHKPPLDLTISSLPRFAILGRDTVLLSRFPREAIAD